MNTKTESRTAARRKTESRLQQEMVQWYRNNYCLKFHDPRHLIFSVPNESRSKQETLSKMAIGMMPGVSDLIVVSPDSVAFVEIKTPTGSQSPAQKDFQAAIETLGFPYHVVRTLEEFKELWK